ncbi:DUF6799 domain-containing protein [Hymenobacter persicinus]|uniref:DUF6799 domain-containing protein n=1 Tax=Hymenobacter persicinus TaxID=2025506 RepID=A0A4Q5L9G8_9BACT|nr:DUF6799 domain-containing protein [Hymenobacter persicinus]RYU78367.1 hypothetical protein EWM57_14445 [Hymenobacter persicinus]
MLVSFRHLLLPALLGLSLGSQAQRAALNDGFQRRDGTMYLIRNGQKRPMAHDVHLPNGRTVTRDGFVVEPGGQRTELAEGRGCTLLGTPATVTTLPSGQLALGSVAQPLPAATVSTGYSVSRLEQLFGRRGHKGWGHYKKKGKHGKKH